MISNKKVVGLGDKETAVALHTFHSDSIATHSAAPLRLTVIGQLGQMLKIIIV